MPAPLTDRALAKARLIAMTEAGIYPTLGINETQSVRVAGGPAASGGFVLAFDSVQTASIAYNETAPGLQAKIESLSNIRVGNVACMGGPLPTAILVTFQSQLGATDVAQLALVSSTLNTGTVTIETITKGNALVIDDLLDEFERASIWTPGTQYVYGAVIIPTTTKRNGHRYICKRGGTSASAEPTWPTRDYARVIDGADSPALLWEEDGIEYDLWDLQAAAHKGWLQKLAKASANIDFQDATQRFADSQVFEHCKEMADRYRPVMAA